LSMRGLPGALADHKARAMKICDLTQSYAPTSGGVRTYVHAKRDFITRHTDDHHLLIVPAAHDGVTREGRCTTYTVASPLVPGSGVYRLLLRSDKVLRILRAEQPEVVEAHCTYNLPWTAFAYRPRASALVVGVFHTDVATAYVGPVVSRLLGRRLGGGAVQVVERYLRALYGRCDATLAVSPAMAMRLRELGLDNVQHLPLGVDLDTFHSGRRDPALRAELGVADDESLLVYAGRFDAEKRPHLVAEAFEMLPATFRGSLVLIGDGPLRPTLEEHAARDRRIRVLPFEHDRTRLAALLASADLYVSAMPFETFGLSVVEAQACGLAVVGVRAGAMIERVPEDVGRLGAVDSPAEMAANILALAGADMRGMGARARKMVEARFSWQQTFERLFAVYGRLQEGVSNRPVGR
jgi:alpha-1,6-mannosyltransferase